MSYYYIYDFDELPFDIVGWKIYYSDHSVFSSNDGSWEEAPDQDVQIVILYQSDKDFENKYKKILIMGNDFYYKEGNRWGTSFDDPKHIFGVCKYGKWTTDENIRNLQLKAIEDREI